MPEFQTTQRVGHSAQKMFELVADIDRYPEFLPLCTSLVVTERNALPDGKELIATMGVGHKALTDSFTTRVHLKEATHKISASYIDGPFEYLENRWHFTENDATGCDVEFYISYAFRSMLMGIALGPMFETAFRRFTTAFEERADEIYGKPTPRPVLPSA